VVCPRNRLTNNVSILAGLRLTSRIWKIGLNKIRQTISNLQRVSDVLSTPEKGDSNGPEH
jgi:hypothetical protein